MKMPALHEKTQDALEWEQRIVFKHRYVEGTLGEHLNAFYSPFSTFEQKIKPFRTPAVRRDLHSDVDDGCSRGPSRRLFPESYAWIFAHSSTSTKERQTEKGVDLSFTMCSATVERAIKSGDCDLNGRLRSSLSEHAKYQ